MNQNEIYCRVINKLLNRYMKQKLKYDLVFYLNPVQHLLNKSLNSDFHKIEEEVSVNLKSSITTFEYDVLSIEIKDCLNFIIPMVEGSDFKKINNINLKIRQKLVSGTLPRKFPNLIQQS